jgi:D-alanyl-D-alanine carboxypeptidase
MLAVGIAASPLTAQTREVSERLDALIAKTLDGRSVEGAIVRIASGDGRFEYRAAAGTLRADAPYFIASATKLFVTAVVLQLRAEGRLALEDRLDQHLPAEDLAGLHVYEGVDRSGAVTIRQLLAQTSGLPDYFEGRQADGVRLDRELIAGRDRAWSYSDVLAWARGMTPRFAPGARGKAYYSDTNYQLLGRVIERVTRSPFDSVVAARIVRPLRLSHTYVYRDTADRRPAPISGAGGALRIPKAMASFGPDGGIVSTADEQIVFLRAFFGGRLFPSENLEEMAMWNRIFFPLQYGVGVMRFRMPRWLSPLSTPPDLRGHSGLSGSFAFYEPRRDLYVTGTLNSVANQRAPYRLLLKLFAAIDDTRPSHN